jgi:hypothetical protein
MSSDNDKDVNFILVRTITPRELVFLLLSRFPTVRDLVCTDQYCFEEPSRVYDTFAKIVRERSDDPEFIQSVVRFIDELAERKDPLIYEVLMSCLLEGIAEDEKVARMIESTMTPHSRSLLHEVEAKIYGRAQSADAPGDREKYKQ